MVGQHIQEAVRARLDLANPLAQIRKHGVIARSRQSPGIEGHTRDVLTCSIAHRADERLVPPRRKLVTLVEREAGYGNRGHPEDDRVLDIRAGETPADDRAIVVAAEAVERPAVVLSGFDEIEFVAALRSFFR